MLASSSNNSNNNNINNNIPNHNNNMPVSGAGQEPSRASPPLNAAASASSAAASTKPPAANKAKPKCRFYGSRSGCRAGVNCPFLHDPSSLPAEVATSRAKENASVSSSTPKGKSKESATERRQAITSPVPASRIVPKPIPKAQVQNPREFQLNQIRRRFSPKETRSSHDDTVLDFSMSPSDPDFPFEMQALHCSLTVPKSYPGTDDLSRPRLKVKNQEFARGFAINIEKGFDGLVEERRDAMLLALITALDKNLEGFLSKKQAETVKLVANVDKRHTVQSPVKALGEKTGRMPLLKPVTSPSNPVSKPQAVFTNAEKAAAKERRDFETWQLESRLGRLPLYKKSGDGIAYTLPIEPRRRSELPLHIQAVKTFQLFVPLLYPLQSCRIQLEAVNPEEALNTELAFQQRATEKKDVSLMGHINYLAQNMHVLAKTTPTPTPAPTSTSWPKVSNQLEEKGSMKVTPAAVKTPSSIIDGDRSHIKIIPRPPEWDAVDSSDYTESDEDAEHSFDSAEDTDEDAEVVQQPNMITEKGTALSFPSLEIYGIELLELTFLNITVKCSRCKSTIDVTGLKNGSSKTESCRKCGTPLVVLFRRDFMHANSSRAGFLDLEGCTVVDMLPSTFTPTCSTCSEVYPAPGIIAVRGDATTAVCRTCHSKLTLKIPETKFLRITSASAPAPTSGPKRKAALGVTAGTELPEKGRCKHYSKSYRWFRFSCCERVYPCDKCHDEKEEHANEHANRMICGWCSREQNYRPEECAFCGRGVVGKKGNGFWEGGRGTRDKVRMSRKDPRKYKRIGAPVKI